MKSNRPPRQREVVGWRELVSLPDFGINDLKAKIDTGARTSALHADELELFERNHQKWVRFLAPKVKDRAARLIEMPLLEKRDIKNTSGIAETRPVVRTLIILGGHRWHIEVSLANRENMGFDLILGRTALRGRNVLVDPSRSFLMNDRRPGPLQKSLTGIAQTSAVSQQGEDE